MATKYLQLDKKKIKYLEEGFKNATDVIQELDSVLYVKIEDIFDNFNSIINELFYPLVDDTSIDYKSTIKVTLPVIDELNKSLLLNIKALIINLPRKEKKKINEFILNEQASNTSQVIEIPKFLTKIINKKFKPKEEFTHDEIITFFSNDTVKWSFNKVLETGIHKKLFNGDIVDFLKLTLLGDDNKEDLYSDLIKDDDIIEFINKIDITEEEESRYLLNNTTFYKLLLEVLRKFDGEISLKVKQDIMKISSGEISLRNEIKKFTSDEK
ncbi:MAG: hypothetical protein HRT73_12265 [Flavobacteriales bacterium]|nr:hypothetical protein [Flavobacteriales bacterium]